MTNETTPQRDVAEDLSALLAMTRYISSEISDLVSRPDRLTSLLAQVQAELEAEVGKARERNAKGLPG